MNDRDPENPVLHATQCASRLMTGTLLVMLFALLTWGLLLAATFFDILRPLGWIEGFGSALIQAGLSLSLCLWGIMIFVWPAQTALFCQALLLRDAPDSTPQGRSYFWWMFLPGFFFLLLPVAVLPSAWKKGRLYGKILALLCVTMYSVSEFWWICLFVKVLSFIFKLKDGVIFWPYIGMLGDSYRFHLSASDQVANFSGLLFRDLFWGVLSLIVASVLLYFTAKNLGEVPRSRGRGILFPCTLGLYLLAPVAAHCCFVLLDREKEDEKAASCSLIQQIRERYLRGGAQPNAEWTEFLHAWAQDMTRREYFSPEDGETPIQMLRRRMDDTPSCKQTADRKKMELLSFVREYLDEVAWQGFSDEDYDVVGRLFLQNQTYMEQLERMIPSGGDFIRARRDRALPGEALDLLVECDFLLQCAKECAARMILATHASDRTRTLEEIRRLQTVYGSFLRGTTSTELSVGSKLPQNHFWLAPVFARRVLNDDDLAGIEVWLLAQESEINSLARGIFVEECKSEMNFERIVRSFGDGVHPERYSVSPVRNTILAPVYCGVEKDFIATLRLCKNDLIRVLPQDLRILEFDGENKIPIENKREKGRLFLGSSFFVRWSVKGMALCSFSRFRLLRIACRVERFRLREGRLPATLDELGDLGRDLPLDPFSGKPFRYRVGEIRFFSEYEHSGNRSSEKTGRGYLLYGVGEDLSDDGGRFLSGRKPKDDILMVLDPGSIQDAKSSDEKKEFGAAPGKNQGDQKHE